MAEEAASAATARMLEVHSWPISHARRFGILFYAAIRAGDSSGIHGSLACNPVELGACASFKCLSLMPLIATF